MQINNENNTFSIPSTNLKHVTIFWIGSFFESMMLTAYRDDVAELRYGTLVIY
jgi:hypothetical protein